MNKEIKILKELDNKALLEKLYSEAFPDEELFPLVSELLKEQENTIHFTASDEDLICGHISFTKCAVSNSNEFLYLLGPLAVLPSHQRKGIGGSLIKEGLEYLRSKQSYKVLVLGDPNYYGRFGFIQEDNITTPYKIPEDWKPAWQSIKLSDSEVLVSGKLEVTESWQKPDLWS